MHARGLTRCKVLLSSSVMLRVLGEFYGQIAEEGWHHPVVSLPLTLPWLALSVVAWLVTVSIALGFYMGREHVFDLIVGDRSKGGRWRDVIYVFVYWVITLAVTLGVGA